MHQNPDMIRLAGGKGREGQPGHHLIRITMIPRSQPQPPKHPKLSYIEEEEARAKDMEQIETY